ncbi:MAG: hypothetical protein R3C99_17955 [Pirellulaceae bacterium]
MIRLPQSENCPQCGSRDFITLHSDLGSSFGIRLVYDRRCADCDTRYSPPVPPAISIMAIVVGIGVAVGSPLLAHWLPAYFDPEEQTVRYGLRAFFYALAFVGFVFAAKGAWNLFGFTKSQAADNSQAPDNSQASDNIQASDGEHS